MSKKKKLARAELVGVWGCYRDAREVQADPMGMGAGGGRGEAVSGVAGEELSCDVCPARQTYLGAWVDTKCQTTYPCYWTLENK